MTEPAKAEHDQRKKRQGAETGPWQTPIRARIARIESEIRLSEEVGFEDPAAEVALAAARCELARARQTLGEKGRRPSRRRYWTGADQEQAWLAVHAAEVQLALARPEEAVRAELPALEAKIGARLQASDPLATTWTEMLTNLRKSSAPLDRYVIRQIKETLFALSDESYTHIRNFRNILALTTVGLVLATALLALPPVSDWVPLCPAAEEGSAPSDEATGEPAPSDGEQECLLDRVWQAELLGGLGGLLAALGAIQRLRGFRNPYQLPLAQALLKVPAGALTGLLGLVLMQGGILFLAPQSGIALIAYVIFFGAAQDLITRLVDRRAGEIADTARPREAPAGESGGG